MWQNVLHNALEQLQMWFYYKNVSLVQNRMMKLKQFVVLLHNAAQLSVTE